MTKIRLILLVLLFATLACGKAPPPPVIHNFGAAPHPAANGGFIFVDAGGTEYVNGPATPAATAANQFLYGYCDAGVPGSPSLCWAQITQDQIGAAFTVSLSFASGSGTYEVGQTATPTYTANPLTNAATVTGCTITDNQSCPGCPLSVSSGSALQAPSTSHTYALTSPGTVTVTVAETLIATGATASGSASIAFDQRAFVGLGSTGTGCTTLTASGSNAVVNCGSATLTGQTLAGNYVGTSFSVSPSTQYVIVAYPHWTTGSGSGGAHTFRDQSGFTFNLLPVTTSYSFTNQFSVGVSMDLYATPTALNASYTVTVQS